MTLSKLLNRLGMAVLYMLRLDADECLSCGEVFRGRAIAWSPAARCSNCAAAASLREPIGPPPEPEPKPKPLPAPRPRRAPAGPDVERARALAVRHLAAIAEPRPAAAQSFGLRFDDLADAIARSMPRPDLVIRVNVGGGGLASERDVTLVVEVGALVATATCWACSWQVNAWVARELELLRAGILSGYVLRADGLLGDVIVVVRKGCLTSYVLNLSGTTACEREPKTFESRPATLALAISPM